MPASAQGAAAIWESPIVHTTATLADTAAPDRGGGGWRGGPGGVGSQILRWLNASFPIGRYFGISVAVHITFIIFIAIELLRSDDKIFTIRWTALLFGSVLLHEFGHCFGCRSIGGRADRILMWPLGGLAFVDPPKRPWPEFVTVACGPLVNVVLAAASYAILFAWYGANSPASLRPLEPIAWQNYPFNDALPALVTDLYAVNYALLLFNLALIFYPFDGGRLVQIALWVKLGYGRSMIIATNLGMIGAIVIGVLALTWNNTLLVLIAFFGFITCYQQKQHLRTMGPDPGFAYGEQPSWDQPQRQGSFARWRQASQQKKIQKQAQSQREREQRIDAILEKVHRQGLNSLTSAEKRALQQDTQRKRGR